MNTRQRLKSYLLPEKKNIVIAFASVVVFLVADLLIPYLVGLSINAIGTFKDGSFTLSVNMPLITSYIIIASVLLLIGVIFDYIFEYQVGIISQHVVKKIRNDVYHKINSLSIEDIYKDTAGNLVQLEIGDVENISTGIFSVFKQLIQGVFTILITIILMFTVNWILALGVIFLTPLSILASRFIAKFSHRHFKAQAKMQSHLNSLSLEAIDNSSLLQSLNYEDDSLKTFVEEDEELRKESKVAQFSACWTNPTTRMVNNTIYAIIGISGIIMIFFTSSYPLLGMTIGALSSFLSYTNQYTKPFNEISSVISEYETAQFSFKRVSSFLNKKDDIDEGKDVLEKPIEEINFNHLCFSYEKDQKLIQDFNLNIRPGEKIAIVGPTGAGKSTLINVLMRFYDPTWGEITYNGIDGKLIKKAQLRKNFGMVLQDTWIFSGTIRDNVRYSKPSCTDKEIKDACIRANADSFINTLPFGYDTKVSAKAGLSEGERQLITIARVMLYEPNIVILDEATSNVDTRTEKKIGEAFDKMMEGKTSIVIAHRLSTIQDADCILVIDKGNIVEQGSHEVLMKKKGFYYSLYTSQFR